MGTTGRLVALVTSRDDPGGTEHDRSLVAALGDAGIEARWVLWDDESVDWADFVMVIVRSPWDYTERYDEFLAWIDRAGSQTQVWNPPELLRWNSHKGYLLELAQRGLPTVPTLLVRAWETCPDLAQLVHANAWDALVIKPAVSVGAKGATRWSGQDAVAGGPASFELARLHAEADVLVQPFVPEITQAGETSVVFLGGRYSHAVRKVPADGDFRVHVHHGGSEVPVQALPDEVRLGRQVLSALDVPTLYARVDCVAVGGVPVLMELEVLEPDLYLSFDEMAPARFAVAVAAHLQIGDH